ncbi:response regulator transcription factor [Dongia sp.]|jgi:CheY-like chemotaxis protein|uniref:response regulator transcription factor n=1 Tax=Dongia sp. TaxID=1977262 RepID=UPI0035B3A319
MSSSTMRNRAVVIEDDVLVLSLTAEILRRAGYVVHEAINGEDGLAKCRAIQPDLVVTDIFMPERDGIEVLREVKKSRPETRVVAISGGSPLLPRMDFLVTADKLGADAVLAKPFTPAQLLAAATSSDWDPDGKVRPLDRHSRKEPAMTIWDRSA